MRHSTICTKSHDIGKRHRIRSITSDPYLQVQGYIPFCPPHHLHLLQMTECLFQQFGRLSHSSNLLHILPCSKAFNHTLGAQYLDVTHLALKTRPFNYIHVVCFSGQRDISSTQQPGNGLPHSFLYFYELCCADLPWGLEAVAKVRDYEGFCLSDKNRRRAAGEPREIADIDQGHHQQRTMSCIIHLRTELLDARLMGLSIHYSDLPILSRLSATRISSRTASR